MMLSCLKVLCVGGKAIQGSKGHEIGQPRVQKGQILLQWYIVASAMWLSLPIKLYMSSSNWGRRLNGIKRKLPTHILLLP